jgi:OFA family oxalate/formate antiporter-like MFS transporter
MIIGHLTKIVAIQSNNTIKIGFMFVALLAIFNAAGRLITGMLSDKIGRIKTIFLVCVTQAIVMFFFSKFSIIFQFSIGSAVVGFSYGACLALFPSTTASLRGNKKSRHELWYYVHCLGSGRCFWASFCWKIADLNGSYGMAYLIASGLMLFAAVLTFVTKSPVWVVETEFAEET